MALTEVSVENISYHLRKKIWEVDDGFHCSIIGVCLRRSELYKLARKKIFGIRSGSTDYEIHSWLVGSVFSRNTHSRVIQKMLDGKYKAAINRYAKAGDDETVKELWRQDLHKGSVAGAYWAVMTHPSMSREGKFFVYGQVHMLGFDYIAEFQRDRKCIEELRNKVMVLEEVIGSERNMYLQKKNLLENEIAELRLTQGKFFEFGKRRENYDKMENEKSVPGVPEKTEKELSELKKQLHDLKERNRQLRCKHNELIESLRKTVNLLSCAEGNFRRMEKEKKELQREIVPLETASLMKQAVTNECAICDARHTEQCPGPDLCGKTVLYVGGLHKMAPRYRQLVEIHGGRFMHHDGGKESSRNLLPKMLTSADAVLCPVDCISHDACLCVKKMCKRYGKPFVMMRSAGISSLMRGLNDIKQ